MNSYDQAGTRRHRPATRAAALSIKGRRRPGRFGAAARLSRAARARHLAARAVRRPPPRRRAWSPSAGWAGRRLRAVRRPRPGPAAHRPRPASTRRRRALVPDLGRRAHASTTPCAPSAEALSVAHDDVKAALGLLDARHVAGDRGPRRRADPYRRRPVAAHRRRHLPGLRELTTPRWRHRANWPSCSTATSRRPPAACATCGCCAAIAAPGSPTPGARRPGRLHLRLLDIRDSLHLASAAGATGCSPRTATASPRCSGFDQPGVDAAAAAGPREPATPAR